VHRLSLLGFSAFALVACDVGDTGNAGSNSCRQRAALVTGVPYEDTTARILGPNISGVASYRVSAGPQIFICNTHSNGNLVSFIAQ
jgi:hypothetical protein